MGKDKYNNLRLISDILIILILSFLPLHLTGLGGILNATDAEFPIYPIKDAIEFSQTWIPRHALGADNFNRWLLPQMPYFLILSLMKLVGMSLGLINRIVLIACLFFLGFGVYCLIKYLTKSRISALVGAVFIIYNPMMHIPFRDLYINVFISYATYPFLVLFILKGLHEPENNFRHIWAIGGISLFWINAPVIMFCFSLCMGIFLLCYFIFNYTNLQELIRAFKFIVKVALVVFIINTWWILPFLLRSQVLYYPYKPEAQMGYLDSGYSLLKLLSFYYSGDNVISSLFGISLMLLVLCAVFIKDKNRRIIPWIILFLLSAFLRKGTHAPLGCIYKWLYLNIPGFGILRSSGHFAYFMFLSGTILIGYSILLFFRRGYWLKILGFIIAFYVIFGSIWNNKVIVSGNLGGRWTPNKIPKPYERYVKWLAAQSDYFRITIPKVVWYVEYTWTAFGFPLIEKFISPKPIVDQFTGSGWHNFNSEKIITKILDSIWKNPEKHLAKLLGMVSCKYIIAHRDTEIQHLPWTLDMNVDKDILIKSKGIKYIKSFGDVDICEIDKKYILPHIFISDSLVYAKDGIDKLNIFSYGNYLDKNNVFYFDESGESIEVTENMKTKANIVVCNNMSYDELLTLGEKDSIYAFYNKGQDLKNAYFYVNKDGDYLFKMKISPNFAYASDTEGVSWNSNFGDSRELDNWKMSPCNITYSFINQNNSLVVETYFDGDDKEDEFLQIKKTGLGVDIKENPCFNLEYKVENPDIQTIEIVFHLDFDNNGSVDGSIIGLYPKPARTIFSNFEMDIYQIVREKFPDKENYIIREVEIYPHKIWWTDCSKEKVGIYRFWVKKVSFYSIKSIDDQIVLDKRDIERKEQLLSSVINLVGIPFLEMDVYFKEEDLVFIQFLLNLDLDGDYLTDTNYFIEYRMNSSPYQFRDLWRINLLEKLEQDFPGAKSYNLIQLHPVCLHNISLERICFSSYKYINVNEINFKNSVFAVDGIKRKMIYKGEKSHSKEIIVTRKLYLKKGIHKFSNYLREGDCLSWDWLLIEPYRQSLMSDDEVKYEKINNTRYNVKLSVPADDSFWLVFNESYSSDWKAYIYKKPRPVTNDQRSSWSALWRMWKDRGNRIELKEHYKVDGFANGWHITKVKTQNEKGKTEEIRIVIEYIPQRWLELGVLISLFGIVVVLKRKYFIRLFKKMVILEENILKKYKMEL